MFRLQGIFPPSLSLAILFFCLLSFFLSAAGLRAAQVTLAWDANREAVLAGYKVYYGPTSHSYDHVFDIGMQTSYALTGLAAGQDYYFAATAYDMIGKESGYSAELSWSSPPTNQTPTAAIFASATESGAPLVSFDGSGSNDADGTVVAYSWNFGDGESGIGEFVVHTFAVSCVYTVFVMATEDEGVTS